MSMSVLLSFSNVNLAPLLASDSKTAIEGEYLVVFKKVTSDNDGN